MAKNKLPPELHLVHGTKGMNQGVTLPEKVKMRIPKPYWLDDPNTWSETRFIRETAEYLYNVYGIGSDQDSHVLGMLANQITTYVECQKVIMAQRNAPIVEYNNGKTVGANPYIGLRDRALVRIISLMNELGLTPRSRLQGATASADDDGIGAL
jgi:phage terminase small subunit